MWKLCRKRYVSSWDTRLLRSITYKTRWDGPALTADKTPAPTGKHAGEHGIYALKRRPTPASPDATYFTQSAFGEVALSGVVVEAERGYRAETAVIRSLWLANPKRFGPVGDLFCPLEIAGLLEDRYAVEVQFAEEDWDEWDQSFGIRGRSIAFSNNWVVYP